VRFKAAEWTAHVDATGTTTTITAVLTAVSDANGALIQSVGNGDLNTIQSSRWTGFEKIPERSRHDGEDHDRQARRDVVWGLVVTGMCEGRIMPVESIASPGNRNLKLTGSLGDVRLVSSRVSPKGRRFNFGVVLQVLRESADLALSWAKMHAYDLGTTNKRAQDPLRIPDATIDLHLHLPAGAKKDGTPHSNRGVVEELCRPYWSYK